MAKISKFITPNVNVTFSHLHRPDDKFGTDSANFNISVTLTPELENEIKALVKTTGVKKVNGIWEDDNGNKQAKFKNRIMVKNGEKAFPCVDSRNQPTRSVPMSGDVVRLLLAPCVIQRDNSLSIYLDGVQIIEKNGSNTAFDVVDGGFTDSADDSYTPNDDPSEFLNEEGDDHAVALSDDDDLPF